VGSILKRVHLGIGGDVDRALGQWMKRLWDGFCE
jgi:hypothetical protein